MALLTDDEIKANIKNNIRHLRVTNGKKQEDVASALGYGTSTISGWETGYRIPDVYDCWRLASYFHVDIDEFVEKDLRVVSGVDLGDGTHLDHVIMDNVRDLSDSDKEKIAAIIDVIKSSN